MLRKCSKSEFEQNIDFSYLLATDLTKSGYPTCCDGIKTKEWFIERSLKAFECENEEMLVFEYDGEIQGFIHYYWIPDDKYLSTISFNINYVVGKALEEFIAFAGNCFKGYELYLGFPGENRDAVECLHQNGFELIEDDYNNTAFLTNRTINPTEEGIVRIVRKNYALFQTLHSQADSDMYWNTDRIFSALDDWIIFVGMTDGEPQGAVYFTAADDGWFEIFGIDMKENKFDCELFRRLLNAALGEAMQRGARFMTFFCDEEGEAIVKEAGFTCIGKYLCFKTRLG